MYHTEGYLDKDTYFTEEHILSFSMAQGKRLCYFWCVSEQKLDDVRRNLEKKIAVWMRQELAICLESGRVGIQKELSRFGASLNMLMKSRGNEKGVVVHLYYQGEFVTYEGTVLRNNQMEQCRAGEGLYLSDSLRQLPEIMECIQGIKEEHSKIGNNLKIFMLRAMSEGRLEGGYFLLWEENDAV